MGYSAQRRANSYSVHDEETSERPADVRNCSLTHTVDGLNQLDSSKKISVRAANRSGNHPPV